MLWSLAKAGKSDNLNFSFPRGLVYTISSIFFVVDRFLSSPNPVKIFGTLGKIVKPSLRDPSTRATFSDLYEKAKSINHFLWENNLAVG